MIKRKLVATLVVSGSLLVGVATYEGYERVAKPPVPGDVPTYGFGSTKGVKAGDVTDPVRALTRLLKEIDQEYATAVRSCVTVPLTQYEFDAYVSLAYNIGRTAFCRSTLVKRANEQDYNGACREILRWDKFKGKRLRGLTIRRQKEYRTCMGAG